jgi:hypothetical protein
LSDRRLKHGRRVVEASRKLEVDRHRAPALLVLEPGAQDHYRASLFLLLSQTVKIVVFFHRE